jgi:hypothetical protein
VVRPDALRTLSPLGLRIVLRHEVTHVATAAWTTPISPRWLIEGFAEYVGNLDSGQPVTFAARELATAVRAGQLPTALPADDAFAGSGAQLARVYQESWLACQYLASRVGAAGLVEFYRAVGTSTAANDQAAAEVLRTTLHETLGTFLAQWRGYLQDLLG